jgi:hypothetical protein
MICFAWVEEKHCRLIGTILALQSLNAKSPRAASAAARMKQSDLLEVTTASYSVRSEPDYFKNS